MWNASKCTHSLPSTRYRCRSGRFYRKGLHKAQRIVLSTQTHNDIKIHTHVMWAHFHNFHPMKPIDICGYPLEINWTHTKCMHDNGLMTMICTHRKCHKYAKYIYYMTMKLNLNDKWIWFDDDRAGSMFGRSCCCCCCFYYYFEFYRTELMWI